MTIKELRKKAKLSRPQLSKLTDVPVRTIENWESGVNTPPDYVEKSIKEAILKKMLGLTMLAYIEENLGWKPVSEEDYIAIAENLNEEIELTVDESGKVWNEGGQYIADVEINEEDTLSK